MARKLSRKVFSTASVWVGRNLMRRVQQQTAKSVTAKGGRTVARRSLSGLVIAVLSAAALAALKAGVDHALADRKERRNTEFDVFNDDDF